MRVACMIAVATLLTVTAARAADVDWNKVDQALGKTGTNLPGGVHKVGLPRTDVHVTVDGVPLKPAFALGGWLAFKPMGSQVMIMGDLVLTESEINPVMAKLLADGISVTALHNHLLRTHPAIFYMHVGADGDPIKLARMLHDALTASATPLGSGTNASSPASSQPSLAIDTGKLDQILGYRGHAAGGVYQFSIPRADTITDDNMAIPPAMGTAIGINFQPTGNGKAAITGDFVLEAPEVNPVLRELRRHGIEVTAVHNHMLDDQPHAYFVHFWANDDAITLAQGLRAALDHVNVAKS